MLRSAANIGLLLALLVALGGGPGFSQTKEYVLDRRSGLPDTLPDYIISVVARDSPTISGGKKFPGHAYAVWQQNGEAPIAYGFYPPEVQEEFSKIGWRGAVVDEFKNTLSDLAIFRLDIYVDKEQFDHSLKAIGVWNQESVEYDLFSQNCTHFVKDVAAAIGLQVPDADAALPKNYVEALWHANK